MLDNRTLNRVIDIIRTVVESSESLALDNKFDRETLILRLIKAIDEA